MKSVADTLRRDTRAADARRTPAERVVIALGLGEADAAIFSEAQGVSLAEARRALARQRQHGRVRSRCHEGLLA